VPLLLVTYDLKTPGHDYTALFNEIKGNSQFWWHYLNNTWLVKAEWNADTLGRHLIKFITANDRLLVIEVTGIGQGWLPNDAWAWIRKNGASP
jgi:hypothetical protein